MEKSIFSLLQGIYLFRFFTEEELHNVASISTKKSFSAGDSIIVEGSKAQSMFVVCYGSVKLMKSTDDDDETPIGVLASGAHFGELPFLDHLKRGLNIVAIENSLIYEISYQALEQLLTDNIYLSSAFYKAVSIFLGTRLRAITTDLTFAREKNLKHF